MCVILKCETWEKTTQTKPKCRVLNGFANGTNYPRKHAMLYAAPKPRSN